MRSTEDPVPPPNEEQTRSIGFPAIIAGRIFGSIQRMGG